MGMKKNRFSKNINPQGQAIVEFAIVLPILLLLLVGILEVGRLVFMYSAVTNASRNAVRYAAAVGLVDSDPTKFAYNDCLGIKTQARNAAFFLNNPVVTITYDHGPGTTAFDTCDGNLDTGVVVDTGDRVRVTVTAQYRPMVRLVPIATRTVTASSYRTILGIVKLAP
jgi:Flp pilus assembly protein TadG